VLQATKPWGKFKGLDATDSGRGGAKPGIRKGPAHGSINHTTLAAMA